MVFSSGERGTNQISKNQLFKGLGKTQKTVDTEFDTFNKTLTFLYTKTIHIKSISYRIVLFIKRYNF